MDTAGRLRRLLAILAWLAQVGEAPIDEVAARFDLSPTALVTELEMAACCGVPPYTPDQLMEIVVTDSTVATWAGTALARPRRLSPPEGFALAASARALLAVSRQRRGRAPCRVRWPSWTGPWAARRSPWSSDAPALLPLVREAAADGKRLRHLPTTRPRPTGSPTGRSSPTGSSPPRATGTWTPAAERPATRGVSVSTGSVPPR